MIRAANLDSLKLIGAANMHDLITSFELGFAYVAV